jgi:4-alpha-glucanotransferase
MSKQQRFCGVLMHPTSFPSPYGIGDLGDEAREFIDSMSQAGVSLWQLLPLGPTGYGDSPYAARSSFAGNELLIDLRALACEGLLEVEDLFSVPAFDLDRVDYGAVRAWKEPLLMKAAKQFLSTAEGRDRAGFETFCQERSWWLDDYALYQVLCADYNDSRWFLAWDKDIAMRKPAALARLTEEKSDTILLWKVLQYIFSKQWTALKKYANDHSIRLVGDIPIFVAPDSVDAWSNRKLLKIDAQGRQKASSGVPPDGFSAEGQLWGNPVYDWPAHEKEHFAWWIRRMQAALQLTDIVRIDHFRGFSAYWEVPAGESTAMNGKWITAPGKELFNEMRKQLGDLPVFAEDLGVITPDVEELRDSNGFPGMKVLQFAFECKDGALDASNAYLPHNYGYNSVAYTGTHDNDTSRGWYDGLSSEYKDIVRRYLECPDDQVVWQMMRSVLMSHAKYAIFPVQDLLGLGAEARMNTPATCGTSNWSWRMRAGAIERWRLDRLHGMLRLYGRDGNTC